MIWDLPLQVQIGDNTLNIRNECDYRVVLDVIAALKDDDLRPEQKIETALYIFYDNLNLQDNISENDLQTVITEMMIIIDLGERSEEHTPKNKPTLMDWEQDFKWIAPPVSRILGYDIRGKRHTHWYTFIGAYLEMGECTFKTIVSIRAKRSTGKPLEKWEINFLREHRNDIELQKKLTSEEEMLLYSQW